MPKQPQAISTNATSAIVFVLYMLGGFFVAQFAGYLSVMPFFDFSMEQVNQFLVNFTSQPSNKIPLLILQAVYSFVLFILAPLAYLYLHEKQTVLIFWKTRGKIGILLGFTFLLMMTYMPLSGYLVQWNEQFSFPESWSSLETLLKSLENDAQKLTMFLISFENLGQFIAGLLVLAILPGVGEELLFRGFLQPLFIRVTGNLHAGIWMAAALFSAFHLQFYGFVPRMALGVLFGYLYAYTGRLWLAMFAHFLNNAYSLFVFYWVGGNELSFGIEGEDGIGWMPALLSCCVVLGLMYYLKVHLLKSEKPGSLNLTSSE